MKEQLWLPTLSLEENTDTIKHRAGFLSQEQLSILFKTTEPCLMIVKPHCLKAPKIIGLLDIMINNAQLNRFISQYINITRKNVFDIYGDLTEVIRRGPNGNVFVENLINSFTVGGKCFVMIVYGEDCYAKMSKIKKDLRGIGSEDISRNVLHCSDNISETIRGVTTLLN